MANDRNTLVILIAVTVIALGVMGYFCFRALNHDKYLNDCLDKGFKIYECEELVK